MHLIVHIIIAMLVNCKWRQCFITSSKIIGFPVSEKDGENEHHLHHHYPLRAQHNHRIHHAHHPHWPNSNWLNYRMSPNSNWLNYRMSPNSNWSFQRSIDYWIIHKPVNCLSLNPLTAYCLIDCAREPIELRHFIPAALLNLEWDSSWQSVFYFDKICIWCFNTQAHCSMLISIDQC